MRVTSAIAAAALMLITASAGLAQELSAPLAAVPEADSLFEEGVNAFRAGEFDTARILFGRVESDWPLHPRTTAAAFMAARALYRAGMWDRAAVELSEFINRWPDSRYVNDARTSLRLALDAADRAAARPLAIGVVLSLDDGQAPQSQELFNGIRLAVDEHNASGNTPPARMIFRDGAASGVGAATESVIAAGADFIVGALFSAQALEAAEVADRAGIPFMAPLATDGGISARRAWSFQANPSFVQRGRLMARFAVNALQMRELGTIAAHDDDELAVLMARAFADEARSLGAEIAFELELPSNSAWFRISDYTGVDTLSLVRAVYAPVLPPNIQRLTGAFLSGLDAAAASVRVLGNSEWHNLPVVLQASRYRVTYANDFFFDAATPAGAAFVARYRALAGMDPGRLAVSGYDVTRFALDAAGTPGSLREALLAAPPFQGLGVRIHFDGSFVNQAMFYHRYQDGQLQLVR